MGTNRETRVEAALRSIIEIGKRDLSNPKYDAFFEEAAAALAATTTPRPTRNWHAIEGPNGRCACGQQPDGTFKDCAQLLAEEVGRESRTLREALGKALAEWEATQADNPLDILQHCITRLRAALAASAPEQEQ